jgi:biotin transport system ATP-binding protein
VSAAQIIFENVAVRFGEHDALTDVSVALTARRTAVIGSNGSGKSTFARMLNGLTLPTSGRVHVHGLDPARHARELRRRVGFIFSNPDAQIVMPTPVEDVAFSLRGSGLSRAEIQRRTADALSRYGLSAHAEKPAHSLSGGQKQLLALCAVLIREPELVVADEPTAFLDAANGRRIRDLLLQDLPQRLVLVTHDMAMAARCDEVIRFEEGRVVHQGEPEAVIEGYERALA